MSSSGWLIAAVLAVVLATIGNGVVKNYRESAARAHAESDLADAWGKSKVSALQEASRLGEAGDFQKANELLAPFAQVRDDELVAMRNQLTEREVRANLAKAPAGDHLARRNMLRLIRDLGPADAGVESDLKRETMAAEHDRLASIAEADRLSKLSVLSLCERLKQRSIDGAAALAFAAHGGRQQFLPTVHEGKIQMGMNEFEITCAWGMPAHSHRTLIGTDVEDKQLIYGDDRSTYVYLHNGIMTAMQQ